MADINTMVQGITATMPNLTEQQSKEIASFYDGSSLKLLENAPLYKSVLGTQVNFELDRLRIHDFRNPLETSGIITTGTIRPGKTLYRAYLNETQLDAMDPVWLTNKITDSGAGTIHAGKPLVPLRDMPKFQCAYAKANLSYFNFITIYDEMYSSNIVEGRAAMIAAITDNLYKKYTKYKYGLESNLIANSYNADLLSTQKLDIDLGDTDYMKITGQGALDLAQALDNLMTQLKVEGTKKFNEAGFKAYMEDENIKLYCRLGFRSAIEKALMANNYFTTDYVQKLLGHIVEIAAPLTPCSYKLKADGTALYPVYAGTSSDTYVGNGVALGLNKVAGKTGSTNVEYTFDSALVEYVESNPEVFGIIVEPGRLNMYISEFGELQSEMTIRDSFAKASDLIIQSFGVNVDNQNIGGSVFIDETYAYIAFINSHVDDDDDVE